MEIFNLKTKKEAKYLIKNNEITINFFTTKNKKEIQEWQIKLDYLEKLIKNKHSIKWKKVNVSGNISTHNY